MSHHIYKLAITSLLEQSHFHFSHHNTKWATIYPLHILSVSSFIKFFVIFYYINFFSYAIKHAFGRVLVFLPWTVSAWSDRRWSSASTRSSGRSVAATSPWSSSPDTGSPKQRWNSTHLVHCSLFSYISLQFVKARSPCLWRGLYPSGGFEPGTMHSAYLAQQWL